MDKPPEQTRKELLKEAEEVCDKLALAMYLSARSIEADDISRAVSSLDMASKSIEALLKALKVIDLMGNMLETPEENTEPMDNVFPFPKPNLN